jgi:hypothetical protein
LVVFALSKKKSQNKPGLFVGPNLPLLMPLNWLAARSKDGEVAAEDMKIVVRNIAVMVDVDALVVAVVANECAFAEE